MDSIACDPPYMLSFMGRSWDSVKASRDFKPEGVRVDPQQMWHWRWAREALRVLKPGGHLLAFGGTRTYHRLACAIEDAGFEIRDCITWMYGSGFPKSLSVSLAIDKAAGVDRSPGRVLPDDAPRGHAFAGATFVENGLERVTLYETQPVTPEARQWEGWGTALKPAFEPIVVARKPLTGTVAATVLEHGTGALNIDGCRIGTDEQWEASGDKSAKGPAGVALAGSADGTLNSSSSSHALGRWPANVVLSHAEDCQQVGTMRVKTSMGVSKGDPDGNGIYGKAFPRGDGREVGYGDDDGLERWACVPDCPVRMLDAQTGKLALGSHPAVRRGIGYGSSAAGTLGERRATDVGGASRFFYTSKASTAERNAGLAANRCVCETNTAWQDGSPTADADPATSARSSKPSSSAAPSVCPDCGGVVKGGRRNVHPLADGQAD